MRLLPLLAIIFLTKSLAQVKNSIGEYTHHALNTEGDPTRGAKIFSDKAICATCHSVDGSHSKVGPDLFSIGDKFSRPDLIKAVLLPSDSIAVGYSAEWIETKNHGSVLGVVKNSTDASLEMMNVSNQTIKISKHDVLSQKSWDKSLMPEGLEKNLSLQEFTDLINYLANLRQAKGTQADASMPEDIAPARAGVNFVPLFGDDIRFKHPTLCYEIPSQENRYIVLEQAGNGYIIERKADGTTTREPFHSWREKVRVGGATGLLNLAFHPKFSENHRYFVKYQIAEHGQIITLIEERHFSTDGKNDDGKEGKILLRIPGVTQDHNGGAMVFGPDGFLYIGMGDTGPQRDPDGHGQDLKTLLGKILRIDVDHASNAMPYSISTDNPFLTNEKARPEIFAYGFREPWRMSFDRETNDFWVGDVGQDRFEEVGIVRKGENHGWNVIEGVTPFSDRYRREGEHFISPVWSYPRRLGVSVTGGYVYRGKLAEQLYGKYIFGDFESRRIWALEQKDRKLQSIVEIARAPSRAVSFSEFHDGELILVGYDDGVIYRMNLDKVDLRPMKTKIIAETSEKNPQHWKFTLTKPAESWYKNDFDDTVWQNGDGGFGTNNTPNAIVRTAWKSDDIWLRRSFTLPSDFQLNDIRKMTLRVHHDEDAEIYINGILAARLNRWTQGYEAFPFSAESARSIHSGKNSLAIHCRQNNGGQYIDAGIIQYVDEE